MLDRQKLKEKEWTVGELVPMLFDNLTGALFVGGCLLLWLNFRRRGRDVLLLTPKEAVDRIDEETANPGLEASHFKKSASQEPHEAIIEYAAHATSSEQSVSADTGDVGDQNSYAGRIALLLTPKETVDRIDEETANPGLEAPHFKKSASQEPHEAIIEYAAHATSSEQSVSTDTGDVGDQNSYAGRIALAMKKAHNQSS
jgi:hypothetical protein